MEADDDDKLGILAKKDKKDPPDKFHVQREKYKCRVIPTNVQSLLKPWIDVKFHQFGYRFYCGLCDEYTMDHKKSDLEKHLFSGIHVVNYEGE